MIEAEFCFLQMERECALSHAVELSQAVFGIAPEAFDSVDVLKGEFDRHSWASFSRMRRKIWFTLRTERPVIAAVCVAVR